MPTIPIASGDDDAAELSNGGSFDAATTVIQVRAGNPQGQGGFRIVGHGIPQYATIIAARAHVPVSPTKVPNDDPNLFIRAHAHDNSPDFVSDADVASRARTTAQTAWIATDVGIGYVATPDFAAVVQEVVDRPGYVDGNPITLLFDGNPSGAEMLDIDAFENENATPLLVEITYALLPRVIAVQAQDAAANLSWDFDAGNFAGTRPGDLLLMFGALGAQGANYNVPATNGTWASLADMPQQSTQHRLEAHSRARAASEASETFTRGTGALSQIALALRFARTLYGADGDHGGSDTDATPPAPALAGGEVGDLIVRCWSLDDRASVTWTPPGDHSLVAAITTGSRPQLLVATKRITVAGAQAAADATSSAADNWATCTVGVGATQRPGRVHGRRPLRTALMHRARL